MKAKTKADPVLFRMALALLYGGIPTPLLTMLGPTLIFPKNAPKLGQNFGENKYCSKTESFQKLPRANSFKESIGGRLRAASRADWESEELERIDENVRSHLGKLAGGKGLEDGEDLGSSWRAVEHCVALLHWLHLDLDLKEIRQHFPTKDNTD